MTAPAAAPPRDDDPNPLVVAPDDSVGPWDGAGIASSVDDTVTAVREGDATGAALAANGVGLDALGFVADPFGSAVSAGVGWLIEHIWFLNEALDALAGDPAAITAIARTWGNVAGELRAVGVDYQTGVPDPAQWDGAAGTAYRADTARFVGELGARADDLDDLVGYVLRTGAAVGTVRSLIRDEIADAVADWVKRLLITLATAPTGPPAIAVAGAAVVSIVTDAVALAVRIGRRVSDLLDDMEAAGGALARIADDMRRSAAAVRTHAPDVHRAAATAADRADQHHVPDHLEVSKELHGAAGEHEDVTDDSADRADDPGQQPN